MPTIEGPKVTLSFDTVLLVIAVILAFFGILVAIVKGVEAWRKISVRDRVKGLENRMGEVEKRLEKGNRKFAAQSDDIGQLLLVMQSLLMHFITGNDHERLRETSNELATYMAGRATREMEDAE
jgi:hypothetical protein